MSATDNETLAENFAAEGRAELLKRFRDAYAKAAGAHADYVSFDADKLESMVQRSVSEADGLQWRRALAGVAARELGIELGLALTHPAVVRAHQLAGAPSYEKALGELAVPPPPAPVASVPEPAPVVVPAPVVPDAPPAVEPAPVEAALPEVDDVPEVETEPELAEPEPELAEEALAEEEALAVEEPLAVEAPPVVEEIPPAAEEAPAVDEAEPVLPVEAVEPPVAGLDDPTMAYEIPVPTDDPIAAEADADEIEELSHDAEAEFEPDDGEFDSELGAEPESDADFTYEHDVLPATAANGAGPGDDIAEFTAVHLGGVASLPSSEHIALRLSGEGLDLMQEDGAIVGRLGWEDISALEVTVPHGRRRRKGSPRLVVHTSGGSARFEVPALSGEELQEQLQPLMARYGH